MKRAWSEFIDSRIDDILESIYESKEFQGISDEFGKVFNLLRERIASLTGSEKVGPDDWRLLDKLETACINHVRAAKIIFYGIGLKEGVKLSGSMPDSEDLIMIAKYGDKLFMEDRP